MNLIGFSLFAPIASITPGPANIAILSVSTVSSFRAGIVFFAGICSGFSLVLLAALLPLAGLVLENPDSLVVGVIKICGGGFLLYIAYSLYRNNSLSTNEQLGFLYGLIIHPTSIKAWVFVVSAYTVFMDVETFNLMTGLMYAGIFLLAAMISHAAWFLLGLLMKYNLSQTGIVIANSILSILLALTVACMLIVQ